jgi:nucleoside-diphosphate-sugar epimerase
MDKRNKKVFITGATGFIGGWCAEAFTLRGGYDVVAGIRTWSKAARIARFGVPLKQFDLLNLESISHAIEGCDCVVHAAVGDDMATIQGTQNLFEAAVQKKVKRIIHISTVAIYGDKEGVIDEDSETSPQTPYAKRKMQSEEVARSYGDRLEVVILRPTIVYGPFSDQWTLNFAQRLYSGKWGLLGSGGDGFCNLVYVGDVVRAIILAIEMPLDAVSEFNINGPDEITWNDFFQRFSFALGLGELSNVSTQNVKFRALVMKPIRTFGGFVLSRFRKQLVLLTKTFGLADFLLRKTEGELKLTPTPDQLALYRRKVVFDNGKSRKLLGYTPLTSADRGLYLSAEWVKHHGLFD